MAAVCSWQNELEVNLVRMIISVPNHLRFHIFSSYISCVPGEHFRIYSQVLNQNA